MCIRTRRPMSRRKSPRYGRKSWKRRRLSVRVSPLARWVRLWFGFRDPVDRRTYFRHGFGLMALKYAIDALLIWRFAGRVWTPLTYLSPLLSARTELLRAAPQWLLPLPVAIGLPRR